MAHRVWWMVEQCDDPEDGLRQLECKIERLGLWPMPNVEEMSRYHRVQAMLTNENPMWPDYFGLRVRMPASRPRVRPMPSALSAVRDATLEEWISRAFF